MLLPERHAVIIHRCASNSIKLSEGWRLPWSPHRLERRAFAFFQFTCGMADEDESADPFAGATECLPNALRIGAPSSYPPCDIAERVGGEQQVHAGGTGRQLLFPDGNLVAFDRRRHQHD